MSQFLIISLHAVMSPIGSILFLWGTLTIQVHLTWARFPDKIPTQSLIKAVSNRPASGGTGALCAPDLESASRLLTHPRPSTYTVILPCRRSDLPAPEPKKARSGFSWFSVFTFLKIPSYHVRTFEELDSL